MISFSRASAATASWEAIGTTVVVQVGDRAALPVARTLLERQLAELDLAASRFRDDSELARCNREAGRWTPVSPLMMTLLQEAIRAAELSDGLVDPAVGWALLRAGYDRDFREMRRGSTAPSGNVTATGLLADVAPATTFEAMLRLDWRSIELDPGALAVRAAPGLRLDLGATAKAFAADRAAHAIAVATGAPTLVSLGGDIATAGPSLDGGWLVRVADDHRATSTEPGQTVVVHSGALATSSTTVRRWARDQSEHHHVIDPRTGKSAATPWRTVSAAAETCIDANIAATTSIVLGDAAPSWLERAGIAARLVSEGGGVSTVCDWPPQES